MTQDHACSSLGSVHFDHAQYASLFFEIPHRRKSAADSGKVLPKFRLYVIEILPTPQGVGQALLTSGGKRQYVIGSCKRRGRTVDYGV